MITRKGRGKCAVTRRRRRIPALIVVFDDGLIKKIILVKEKIIVEEMFGVVNVRWNVWCDEYKLRLFMKYASINIIYFFKFQYPMQPVLLFLIATVA